MDDVPVSTSRSRRVLPLSIVVAVVVATLAMTTSSAGAQTAACPGGNYTVVAGDGWTSIAKKLRIYTRELLALNDATLTTTLFPGQVLCLPLSPLVTTPTTATATPSTAATATTVSATTCTGSTYRVVAGDGWYSIADKVDVAVLTLLRANNASTATRLFPGMTLCVPSGSSTTTTTTTTTTPTIATAAPGTTRCNGATYTVVRNDGWRKIATKLGVTLIDLLTANQATVATALHPGDSLCVPGGAAPSTAATATTTTTPTTAAAGVPSRCITDALADGKVLCVDQTNRSAWGLTFVAGRATCPNGTPAVTVTYGATTESVCILRRMAARTGRGTFEATGTGCAPLGAGRYLATVKARSISTRTADRAAVQVNDVVFFGSTCTWATSVHEVIDDTAAANNDLTRGNNNGWINLIPADSDWVYDFLEAGDTVRLVGSAT